jgi:hypothetical protein
LVVFYDSTGGPNWKNHTQWLETNTPCSWHGLWCDGGGYITGIYLYDNNLVGNIPPQLAGLTHLNYLCLCYNHLSGAIPPELGNLTKLGVLYLEFNALSGSIPPELGRLVNVQNLNLDYNLLTGSIPPELGNMVSLINMHLNNNQLSGSIPPELGKLEHLYRMYLWSNQLSGPIPPELGNLKNLGEMYLTWNRLSDPIPAELGKLANLVSLNFSYNGLAGPVPAELTNLTKLGSFEGSVVDFGYNTLFSSDPAVIDFLNARDPDWASTQTAPPTGLQAVPAVGGMLFSWTPVSYTQDGGFYEISFATTLSGPYTVFGDTVDKAVVSILVTGLSAETPYYLRLRTYTPAHGEQQNDLWSKYTQPVSNTKRLFMPVFHR